MVLGHYNNLTVPEPYYTDARSVWLLGKPQTGKTTTINRLVLDEIYNGQPVVYIGGVGEVLAKIPPQYQDKVLYFSPHESPFAFNLFHKVPKELHPLFASTLLMAIKDVWGYGNGTPNIDQYLLYGIQTLLSVDGSSLLSLKFLLANEKYRADVKGQITDKILKDFWKDFEQLTPKERRQDISSTLNKVRMFMLDPLVRNCLDQKDNKLVFDKIVLINLDEAKLGQENARLLGALILSQLYIESLQGLDTTVFIDDAYRYGSGIIERLMACPLTTVIATQFLEQFLDPFSILSSTEQVMAFCLGMRDSQFLEPDFFLDNSQFLFHQDIGKAYVQRYFRALELESFPNTYPLTNQRAKILKRCASQCTQPIKTIEKRLDRFLSWRTSA